MIKPKFRKGIILTFILMAFTVLDVGLSIASLTDGVVSYYTLDNTTGNAIDTLNIYNLTETGTVPSGHAILGNARGTFSSSNYFESSSYLLVDSNKNYTISAWINKTASSISDQTFLSLGSGDVSAFQLRLNVLTNGSIQGRIIKSQVSGIDLNTAATINNNGSIFIIAEYNSTHLCLTINNTDYGCTLNNHTGLINSTVLDIGIAKYGTSPTNEGSSLVVDEVGIWNRTLDSSEKTQLFNSGVGTTYPFNVNPVFSDTKPVSNSTFEVFDNVDIGVNVTFSFPLDDIYANITYPNGTKTQLTLLNSEGNNYNASFAVPNLTGQYNVSYFANDTSSNLNNNETSYFNIIDIVNITINSSSCDLIPGAIDRSFVCNLTVPNDPLIATISANVTYPNNTISSQTISGSNGSYYFNFTDTISGGLYNISWRSENSIGEYDNIYQTINFTTLLNVTGYNTSVGIENNWTGVLYDNNSNVLYNLSTTNGTIGYQVTQYNNYTIIAFQNGYVVANLTIFVNQTLVQNQNITLNPTLNLLDDCSINSNLILNYTLYDETTKSQTGLVNPVIESVTELSYNGTNVTINLTSTTKNMTICVANAVILTPSQIINTVTRYYAENKTIRFNYLQSFPVVNSTQNIGLYVLSTDPTQSEYSTSFLINYQSDVYLPVRDAIVDLYRYYVGANQWVSVENGKTDNDGNTRLHLVTEDVRYKAIIRKNNAILYSTSEFLALCQASPCQINFQEKNDVTEVVNWTVTDNLQYNILLDNSARTVDVNFASLDGISSTFYLNVTKYDNWGNDTICSDVQSTNAGTLSCTIPVTARNSTYLVEFYRDDGQLSWVASRYFTLQEDPLSNFGTTGIIMTFLLYLTLVLMAVPSGIITVISFGIIGLVIATILGIFAGGSIIGVGSIMIWLIAGGAIIIYKASERE